MMFSARALAFAFAVVVMSSCVADGVRTIPGNSPELRTTLPVP